MPSLMMKMVMLFIVAIMIKQIESFPDHIKTYYSMQLQNTLMNTWKKLKNDQV